MSLRSVTYYEPECDDCGLNPADWGGEFVAWADRLDAVDVWIAANHWNFGTALLLCNEHAPRCPHGFIQWDEDADCDCDECEDTTSGEAR